MQTSGSLSAFAGREEDRGNEKLLRRGDAYRAQGEGVILAWRKDGREGGEKEGRSDAALRRREQASFIFLGKAEEEWAGQGRTGQSHGMQKEVRRECKGTGGTKLFRDAWTA